MAIKDTFALQLRRDACTQCGICADSCPFGAIQFNEYPEVDPYSCRLCGTCVQACPAEAWDMQEAVSPVAQPAVSAKEYGFWPKRKEMNWHRSPVNCWERQLN